MSNSKIIMTKDYIYSCTEDKATELIVDKEGIHIIDHQGLILSEPTFQEANILINGKLKVYKNGLRKYTKPVEGEPTTYIEVIKKLSCEEVSNLPEGTRVYITDTCEFPFYMKTSGYCLKTSYDVGIKKWGLRYEFDRLYWTEDSIKDGRIEVYLV